MRVLSPPREQVKLLEGENGRYQREVQELQARLGQEERKEEEARRKAFAVKKRVLECEAGRDAALSKVSGDLSLSLPLPLSLSLSLALSLSLFLFLFSQSIHSLLKHPSYTPILPIQALGTPSSPLSTPHLFVIEHLH